MNPARRTSIAYVVAALACITITVGACTFPTIEYDTSGNADQASSSSAPACYAPETCAMKAWTCGDQARDRNTACVTCKPQPGQSCGSEDCAATLASDLADCNAQCQQCSSSGSTPCENPTASCQALVNQ